MAQDQSKAVQSWNKFLDPKRLRANLTVSSVYLAAYELLLQALVEQLEAFFVVHGLPVTRADRDEYKAHVLALDEKHRAYHASVRWLHNTGAINAQDVVQLHEIRDHRNFVAHNIPSVLLEVEHDVRHDLLREISRLVTKIDRWWIREVHLSTSGEMTGPEIDALDDDEINSLRLLVVDMLVDLALGDGNQLASIYAQMQR